MEPYQQPPAPTPEQDPYHFIMNGQNTPKKTRMPSPNSNSLRGRLIIILGGALVLGIAIIIFSSLVFGGREKDSEALVALVAQQQEIVRVADLGLKDATDISTKNYVQTVKLSVMTQQNELTAYLAKKKQVLTPIQLASKKNATTDSTLATALKANRFDDTVVSTLKTSLLTYQKELQRLYGASVSAAGQTILKNGFASTALLLK